MRLSGMGLLLTVALLMGSCSFAASTGSLTHYERNASARAFGLRVDSLAGQGWSRLDDSQGCFGVTVPWTISIGPAGPDGQVGDDTILLTSGDVADPTNAEIWIDIAEDGSVTWGHGRPAWAIEGEPLRCGSSE